MEALTALDRLQLQPKRIRAQVVELLDEISRPLSPRELDEAFRLAGFSRSQRKAHTRALKGLSIIAVVENAA